MFNFAEAEFLAMNEGNIYTIAMRDRGTLPWSKAILRTQESLRDCKEITFTTFEEKSCNSILHETNVFLC
jgi:hypothetical protein